MSVFVLVILSLVTYLLFVFVFNRSAQQHVPAGNSAPPAASAGQLLSPQGTFPDTWMRERDPEYAVAYPPSWHTELLSVPETHLYIDIVPKTATADDIFPRLDMLFYSSRNTSIQSLLNQETSLYNQYSKSGSLQQTTITFQGVSAIQLSGTIDGNAYVQGNPTHTDVVKTFIFFQKGNTIYVVDDAYYNDQQADQNKQVLLQILATMNFTQ